jgi:hypothetical protein
MRGKWKQWEWIAWTGIAAFFVGLLISPAIARILPFGWDSQIAAFIMQADRWRAGVELMRASSPAAFADLDAAAQFVRLNKDALTACREAAAKSKKEQHCTLVLPPP